MSSPNQIPILKRPSLSTQTRIRNLKLSFSAMTFFVFGKKRKFEIFEHGFHRAEFFIVELCDFVDFELFVKDCLMIDNIVDFHKNPRHK